jgi:hypothetical protein
MAEQAQGGEQQAGQRPVGDVFSQFGEELTDSLRQEFAQLRAEAADRARAGVGGGGLVSAAGVSGAVGAGAALTLPVLALRRILPPSATAVVVAAGAGGLSAYLAKRGLDELGVPTDAAADRVKEAARDAVSAP